MKIPTGLKQWAETKIKALGGAITAGVAAVAPLAISQALNGTPIGTDWATDVPVFLVAFFGAFGLVYALPKNKPAVTKTDR